MNRSAHSGRASGLGFHSPKIRYRNLDTSL